MIPIRDSNPRKTFPIWILVIILINAFVFYMELTSPDPEGFINRFALVPKFVDPAQPASLLPFITSQFLHAGFLHIISNMLFFWVFGDNVEDYFGFILFPALYLLYGIAGGLLQYIFLPDSTIPMLGASGAIAGIMGAYFALYPGNKVKTLVFIFIFVTIIDIPAWIMLLYWFVIQLFSGLGAITEGVTSTGGIAWFAHVGGFVLGFLTAKLIPRNKYI